MGATERDYKTVFSIESVDLTFLAQAFAEQYEKHLAEQHLPEKEVKTQIAT